MALIDHLVFSSFLKRLKEKLDLIFNGLAVADNDTFKITEGHTHNYGYSLYGLYSKNKFEGSIEFSRKLSQGSIVHLHLNSIYNHLGLAYIIKGVLYGRQSAYNPGNRSSIVNISYAMVDQYSPAFLFGDGSLRVQTLLIVEYNAWSYLFSMYRRGIPVDTDVWDITCLSKTISGAIPPLSHPPYIEGVTTDLTYLELKYLRDNSLLVPGHTYCITDFTTTTSKKYTRSANHAFRLIVTAIDSKTLSEKANAQPSSNNYFEGQNLGAWQIWYSLDNDKSRFEWADDTTTIASYDKTQYSYFKITATIDDRLYGGICCRLNVITTPGRRPLVQSDGTMYKDGTLLRWFPLHLVGYIKNYDSLYNIEIPSGQSLPLYIAIDEEGNHRVARYDVDQGKNMIEDSTVNVEVLEDLPEEFSVPNGKGVIYRMIDEYGNDLPYDFKNIQIHEDYFRNTDEDNALVKMDDTIGDYLLSEDGYYYTFSSSDGLTDLSLSGTQIHDNRWGVTPVKAGGYNNQWQLNPNIIIPGSKSFKQNHFEYFYDNIWVIPSTATANTFDNHGDLMCRNLIKGSFQANMFQGQIRACLFDIVTKAYENSFSDFTMALFIYAKEMYINRFKGRDQVATIDVKNGVIRYNNFNGFKSCNIEVGTELSHCQTSDWFFNNNIKVTNILQSLQTDGVVRYLDINVEGTLGYIHFESGCQYLKLHKTGTILNIKVFNRVRGTNNQEGCIDLSPYVRDNSVAVQNIYNISLPLNFTSSAQNEPDPVIRVSMGLNDRPKYKLKALSSDKGLSQLYLLSTTPLTVNQTKPYLRLARKRKMSKTRDGSTNTHTFIKGWGIIKNFHRKDRRLLGTTLEILNKDSGSMTSPFSSFVIKDYEIGLTPVTNRNDQVKADFYYPYVYTVKLLAWKRLSEYHYGSIINGETAEKTPEELGIDSFNPIAFIFPFISLRNVYFKDLDESWWCLSISQGHTVKLLKPHVLGNQRVILNYALSIDGILLPFKIEISNKIGGYRNITLDQDLMDPNNDEVWSDLATHLQKFSHFIV